MSQNADTNPAIEYYKVPALLGAANATGGYWPRMASRFTLDFDMMADRIVMYNSTVTKPDVVAILTQLGDVVRQSLLSGFNINFNDLFMMSLNLSGSFETLDEPLDWNKHSMRVVMRASKALETSLAQNARFVCISAPVVAPQLTAFRDTRSATDTQVSPGGSATLAGRVLAFDATKEDEGLFFVTGLPADATYAEVRVTTYAAARASSIVFEVPATLVANTVYRLELRSRMGSVSETAELRIGRLKGSLTCKA